MALAAQDGQGSDDGIELGTIGVVAPGSPAPSNDDRPTADLVPGDGLSPTHSAPSSANEVADAHRPAVTAGIPSTVFNFLNSIVGGA